MWQGGGGGWLERQSLKAKLTCVRGDRQKSQELLVTMYFLKNFMKNSFISLFLSVFIYLDYEHSFNSNKNNVQVCEAVDTYKKKKNELHLPTDLCSCVFQNPLVVHCHSVCIFNSSPTEKCWSCW